MAEPIDLLADNIKGDGWLLADRRWCISCHVIAEEKWHCVLRPFPVRLAITVPPPAWGWKMLVWFIAERTRVSHPWTQTGTCVLLHVLHFLGDIALPRTLWRARTTETRQMLTCENSKVFYQYYFCYFLQMPDDCATHKPRRALGCGFLATLLLEVRVEYSLARGREKLFLSLLL